MAEHKNYRTILLFGMPGSGKGTQGLVLGQLPDLVHVSMGDVFRRVMNALEPDSDRNPIWFLGLVGVIGSQLFYLFNLFTW